MQPLSSDTIEAVFTRMSAAYGGRFVEMWQGFDMPSVKAIWAQDLRMYSLRPKALAWALDNLPDSPPSCPMFKRLCEAARAHVFEQWEIDDAKPRLLAKAVDLLR